MSMFDCRAKTVPDDGLAPRAVSSGPKIRLKAICCSSFIGWPGKTSTGCVASARRISVATGFSIGWRTSMPVSSAASPFVKSIILRLMRVLPG
jgi:hypothetical protein